MSSKNDLTARAEFNRIMEEARQSHADELAHRAWERCDERFDMAQEVDPTPWCLGCGAMTEAACDCGPIAENN